MNRDRARWNEKYCGQNAPSKINAGVRQYAHLLKPGRVLDLAGGSGQNAQWLAAQGAGCQPIVADISDEALMLGDTVRDRVLCDAAALPFVQNAFDTVLCTRFYDPRVRFGNWLASAGTVLFETFTLADAKYRPDFNPAHRFDLKTIPELFADLEILIAQETDDGSRVFVTVIARKPI